MNQRLENYLEIVNEGLRKLPTAEREAEIAELEQHLRALVQAREELGQSEESALTEAIQQFGQASDVRRRLVAAYRRRRLARFRQTWLGAVLCTFFATCVAAFVSTSTLSPLYHWVSGDNNTLFLWSLYVQLFIQGYMMGWLSYRLSGWKCLPVMAVWAVWFYSVYIAPQLRHEDMPYAIWVQTVVSTTIIIGTPLVSASIALGKSKKFLRVADSVISAHGDVSILR
jgi:uncharacterized membrane protein